MCEMELRAGEKGSKNSALSVPAETLLLLTMLA